MGGKRKGGGKIGWGGGGRTGQLQPMGIAVRILRRIGAGSAS